MKKVLILHDNTSSDDSPDEADNLIQVKETASSLAQLGFSVFDISFEISRISQLADMLNTLNPDFVFNLTETVSGSGEYSWFPVAFLEILKIKHTGCSASAIQLTTNKIISKQMLRSAGLSTPEWVDENGNGDFCKGEAYIIKPLCEEGSVDITAQSVVYPESKGELVACLKNKHKEKQCIYFAERYIHGKEFCTSVLGNKGCPEILPVAQMKFSGFKDKGQPEILSYDAKWEKNSFVYGASNRSFELEPADIILADKMKAAATECWQLFGLGGYARLDFRADDDGNVFLIDINANPCIASDSGFTASAAYAGMDFNDVISRIVLEAENTSL